MITTTTSYGCDNALNCGTPSVPGSALPSGWTTIQQVRNNATRSVMLCAGCATALNAAVPVLA